MFKLFNDKNYGRLGCTYKVNVNIWEDIFEVLVLYFLSTSENPYVAQVRDQSSKYAILLIYIKHTSMLKYLCQF